MIGPEETDALLARIAMADRDAFQTFYSATSASLFGVCLRVLNNDTEAEDVIQTLYADVWDDADALRRGAVTPDLQLALHARQAAISLKRARRSETPEIKTRDLYPSQHAHGFDYDTEAEGLQTALAQLPPARALLLDRGLIGGESYEDLATASDVDEPTIRASIRSTLGKLSSGFDPVSGQDEDRMIAIAERVLGLKEDSLNDATLRTSDALNTWQREIGAYVLARTTPIEPPSQVSRRITARVFQETRETLWDQLWPYAVGGVVAALVLWVAVSSDVLVAFE